MCFFYVLHAVGGEKICVIIPAVRRGRCFLLSSPFGGAMFFFAFFLPNGGENDCGVWRGGELTCFFWLSIYLYFKADWG